ncbi:hypothetical protein GNI_048870 [Gregarina niphandrodes]|uniref:Uncharacterized protein n=1 Tax=Gregarina niphandrodes TaxID=110365 RepID=A0A023B9Q1_GRENI|nr:hypothetical protein GNI_048870 [Gregarina niphandrodes]EZG73412.1 hypothetical protein GNI_048870 [Gregarina niphandrodes]|eukprot:XP_011129650.1 hypothetical protein GNI_048870 [Gregarina niphandrodes]
MAYVREPRSPSPTARRRHRGPVTHPPLTAFEGEPAEAHRSHRGSALNVLIDASASVAADDLCLFLRKARRKLRDGIFVTELRLSRVKSLGTVLKQKDPELRCTKHMRQLYIGFQPEYLELTTQYSIETTLHLSAIDQIKCSAKAEPFRRHKQDNVLNDKCCLLITSSAGDQICLLFTNEEDRRLTQFHLRVERAAVVQRYQGIESDYLQLLKDNHINDVGLARSVLTPSLPQTPNAKAKAKAKAQTSRT